MICMIPTKVQFMTYTFQVRQIHDLYDLVHVTGFEP